MDHGSEIDRGFLKARPHGTALLKPSCVALNHMALSVTLLVELQRPAFVVFALVLALRNGRFDSPLSEPLADTVVAVALIAGHTFGACAWPASWLGDTHGIHRFFELRRVVDLSCGDVGGKRQASAVNHQVDFAPKPASGAAKGVVGGLLVAPFLPAPAAERVART